jgi:hypothetical protein
MKYRLGHKRESERHVSSSFYGLEREQGERELDEAMV